MCEIKKLPDDKIAFLFQLLYRQKGMELTQLIFVENGCEREIIGPWKKAEKVSDCR